MKILLLLSLLFTTPSFAEMMCDDATDYFAIYEINTYTCESGKYLPANTEGCQPCPTGFTCNGGTYEFNPDIYQGAELDSIPTTTMNNICADNFPTEVYAIYKPNTINLNWWNGNGSVAQTTCEYDGTITLPTTPTRTGYTFAGWKLKTNN